MAILKYGNKFVSSGGKLVNKALPSESPAISTLHNFLTGINAFMVDYDRLPTSQLELDPYVSLTPSGVYSFAYFNVDTSLGYCNATSSNGFVHSYTMTISWNLGTLNDITCKKLGTQAPGCADYIDGVLSCQVGTQEA